MFEHAFELFSAKNFEKALREESVVYILVVCNILSTKKKESTVDIFESELNRVRIVVKTIVLSTELKKYENVFLIEEVVKLSLHKEHDHAIKTTVESLYNSLYNLLNIKLTALRRYLNDVLTKK